MIGPRIKNGLLIIAAVLSLMGCGSTGLSDSVPWVFGNAIGRDAVLQTSAERRAIIRSNAHPTSRPGHINPESVICAEPSPDVAEAIAKTFGVNVSVRGAGGGALSSGQATALAQLAERTVTVQLLRDQMYRACEAYANGAISATEYSLLMSRNNDAMVTLMLGEAASRTIGRRLAVAAVGAGSASGGETTEVINAALEVIEKQQAATDASAEAAAAVENKAAADVAVEAAGESTGEDAQAIAAQNADVATMAVATTAEAAEKRNEDAEASRQRFISTYASNEAEGDAVAGGFANGLTPLSPAAADVAKSLVALQAAYFDQGSQEHFISACIVELGRNHNSSAQSLYSEKALEENGSNEAMAQFLKSIKKEGDRRYFRSSDRAKASNRMLRAATALADRTDQSALAEYCWSQLDSRLLAEYELIRDRLDAKRQLDLAAMKNELAQKYLSCRELSDPTERAHCQNAIAAIAEGVGAPAPLSARERSEK